MKIKEIRQKTNKELQDNLVFLGEKLRELRFNLVGGKVKNIREVHQTKKNIAKILTVLKQNGPRK
jgi:ribosomal protein L29